MPAKDIYHDTIKNALIKDGWTITDDPLRLVYGKQDVFVDLGAEKLLAAEKGGRKIAVEIKSFRGRSEVEDLEKALGQYILYEDVLTENEPERELFLAVIQDTFEAVFTDSFGKLLLEKKRLKLLVVKLQNEEIVKWISWKTIGE
ncbi:MAG: XisH family protein [Acidobacteriota bacterium]|nr:XisH family protein [Acidobacteriota bacterium]